MGLKEKIEGDLKKAMLAKAQDEVRALRAIKSLILLAETSESAKGPMAEDEEMKLLTKAAKQRKESLEIFEKEGRADLALKEREELEVIQRYLPAMLTDDELKAAVTEIISQVGATGPSDLGKVMGVATKTLAGKADGKAISALVKQLLG
jgi:uncharacterized protein YqeY